MSFSMQSRKIYTGTREPAKRGTSPQTPSRISNGFFMVRHPVSFLPVWQESVWHSRQQIVADVLACHLRIVGNELAHGFPLDDYPVYEIVDFHIRAEEHSHLARRCVFQRIRRVNVMCHKLYDNMPAKERFSNPKEPSPQAVRK